MKAQKQQFDLDELYPPEYSPCHVPRMSIAWLALRNLLICLGAVASFAYLAAMPWSIRAVGVICAGVAWGCMYKMHMGRAARGR